MTTPYLTRSHEIALTQWLDRPRRKPLIVRGARQVGKSTLIRSFGTRSRRRLVEVNIEEHRTGLRQAIERGHFEEALSALCRVGGVDFRENPAKHLLFLDEIQVIPACLTLLRYLYEKLPELAVIAAGSVLEFTLNSSDFSMPVGRVEYLHVAPLSFSEFLDARGLSDLLQVVERASPWTATTPTPSEHARLMSTVRDFFLVGGMPEAVLTLLDEGVAAAGKIQSGILASYRDDLQKYPGTAHIRSIVRDIFDRSPLQIGKKIKYSNLSPEHPSRDVKKGLRLLLDAGVLTEVTHSDGNGVPLGAESDLEVRKLFSLDVGLLCSACGISHRDLPSAERQELINSGVLAEQFVAQELLAGEPGIRRSLHYWLREGKSSNAEVDFLWSVGKEVVPVEVKAGTSGRLRSLHEFARVRPTRLAVRFDGNIPTILTGFNSLRTEGAAQHEAQSAAQPFDLISLPLYLTSQLNRIVREWQERRGGSGV